MRFTASAKLTIGAATAAFAFAIASCGHGSSGVAPGFGQRANEKVSFHITVPTPGPTPTGVHSHYVSQGTTDAGVTVTPQGGVPYPTVYFSCTSQACTGSVPAPVGQDSFLVSLYGAHRISPDTLLSTGTTVATIQPGIENIVNVTFDPVVSSIVLSVLPTALPPGVSGQATVTVNATDATGASIVGPGTYVNSAGAALTIDLSTFDKLLNGHQGHDTTLSSNSLTGPPASGPTQVTLSYNGDPNLGQTTINATTTVSINGSITPATLIVGASPSPTPAGCDVSATPNPAATFFKVPKVNGNPFATVGDSISTGPDGNLWSSDGNKRIFQATTAGKITSFDVPGAGAGSLINTVTSGPKNGTTVWFADPGTRQLGRVTVGAKPSITMFDVPDIEPPNLALPAAVAAGPDGNMWFTDRGSDYLGQIFPLVGTINEYPITQNSSRLAQGLVLVPNGQLWFVESGLAKLGMVQISSLQLGSVNAVTEINAGGAQAGELRVIAADPNGNIWFSEPTSDKVARVNVSAVPITVDEFSVPTAGAQPFGITAGPDGAMWFAEVHGKKLGRIAFDAAPGTSPQEFTFGFAAPAGLVTGPDCNLWVTDQASPVGRIGKITF